MTKSSPDNHMIRFLKEKAEKQSKCDLSKKGSIDVPIQELVDYLNQCENYYTTSSCSGRIILVTKTDFKVKKGCNWLWVSHELVTDTSDIKAKLLDHSGNAEFKYEPFVMHVCCSSIHSARLLLNAAIAAGFRNTGMTVAGNDRIIAAIRSTHSLQVPLSQDGKLLVSYEYVDFLVNSANEKLNENFNRISKFFDNIKRNKANTTPYLECVLFSCRMVNASKFMWQMDSHEL